MLNILDRLFKEKKKKVPELELANQISLILDGKNMSIILSALCMIIADIIVRSKSEDVEKKIHDVIHDYIRQIKEGD